MRSEAFELLTKLSHYNETQVGILYKISQIPEIENIQLRYGDKYACTHPPEEFKTHKTSLLAVIGEVKVENFNDNYMTDFLKKYELDNLEQEHTKYHHNNGHEIGVEFKAGIEKTTERKLPVDIKHNVYFGLINKYQKPTSEQDE